MRAPLHGHRGGFVLGLGCGLGCGLLPQLLFATADIAWVDGTARALEWPLAMLQRDLRGSLLPFVAVLLFYGLQLRALGRCLRCSPPPLERALRHEQLIDLCANLFFGIGVIWTAIGLRAALLHALSSPLEMSDETAFTVLQRLVDGGILLALSTTIVGGVGGYLMRAFKTLALGPGLDRLYVNAGREPLDRGLALLQRIAERLEADAAPGGSGRS